MASITHVAKLSILTKTRDSACGYRASYNDGRLVGKPSPTAANQGTQITVQDLFYNVPTRKRALKSGSDEFHRVADVVSKYAIHNVGVSFSLKKEGDATLYVRTSKDFDVKQNIAAVFGHAIAKELIEVEKEEARHLRFKLRAQVTNVNYNTKKFNFLLFINHRLVECGPIKKALEMVYSAYLPKGTHPFVYMSLEIDPRNVDVNVHPTKHEVQFLHQDEIIELVQQAVDAKLMGANNSRTFYAQALLPGAIPRESLEAMEKAAATTTSGTLAVKEKEMIRTDAREQKLDKFLDKSVRVKTTAEVSVPISDDPFEEPMELGEVEQMEKSVLSDVKPNLSVGPERRDIRLASVRQLREQVRDDSHEGLRGLMASLHFVGCVNPTFSLIQHSTKLYLANIPRLSEHLFYQIVLRDFGNFAALRLDPAPSLKELAMIALDSEDSGWTEADGSKEDLAQFVVKSLMDKAEMLDDYFSLELDQESETLITLPLLLNNFVPFLTALPTFILRIATEVIWDDEISCFQSFASELAKFYAVAKDGIVARYDTKQHEEDSGDEDEDTDRWKEVVEQIVMPACKKMLWPPKTCTDDMTLVQVANLPDLYKVFERC